MTGADNPHADYEVVEVVGSGSADHGAAFGRLTTHATRDGRRICGTRGGTRIGFRERAQDPVTCGRCARLLGIEVAERD